MRRFLFAGLLSFAAPALAAPGNVGLSYMDRSVAPGADFFRYGNGGWQKTAKIPADRSYTGVNLEIDLANERKLKDIVAGLAANPHPSAEEAKLRDFHAAFMDRKAIEAAGLAPVKADLARIRAAASLADIARLMADPALSLDGPFAMDIDTDNKHPDHYAVHLVQSGLAMPDRDYYLKDEAGLVAARAAYKKYLAVTLGLLGDGGDAAGRADAVYALEEKIARASWPADDRRDEDKIYNPMTAAALAGLAPKFPWEAWLTGAGLSTGPRIFIVHEKSAFAKLADIFAATPLPVWKDYLATRELHGFADELPARIDDSDFAFYGVVIGGSAKQLDLATRGIHLLDGQMGEALGKLYVARWFPPSAKAKVTQLVRNLVKAYADDIRTLDWMAPATRAQAEAKLANMTIKVGYPDRWRDYSALAISRSDPVGDLRNARQFEWRRQVARIDRPMDKGEWGMTPPTNNAYNNPTLHEIVFPAGILQPPYFDPAADDSVNYGEIGGVIGHEISHSFDDQGSKYDANGVLRNWWTAADRRNFDTRTSALAKQYDAYEPLPGLHIKGKLTLGENIADLAGLVIAYKAYHIALAGKPAPVMDGLTGDQRFYVAYAQSWREIWSDARTRRVVLSNPHSPSNYRVNGVVRNDDGWYAAFPQVKAGDAYWLALDKRVKLW